MDPLKMVSTASAPAAIGPYSQAMVCNGMVHTAGQVALDPGGGELVAQDVVGQTEQVFKNLTAVLEAAGSSLGQVVKTTVFMIDLGEFAAMNEVYATAFGDHRPARSTVEVSRLPKDARVEIDVVARVG
jgi:2-iminobutanoate/2-iminopropanoate deaminase